MNPREATILVFEELWNRGNIDRVRDVVADELTFHVGGKTRLMTSAELESLVTRWRTGFPDLHFELRSVVASKGRTAVHATLTGTNEGTWRGREPTGRSISVEHMFFFRFEDDRIVEVWELLDHDALRSQLSPSRCSWDRPEVSRRAVDGNASIPDTPPLAPE